MKTILTRFFAVLIAGSLASTALADDVWGKREHKSQQLGVTSTPLYKEECGSCHFAYPPQLLPSASWRKIMAGLDNHFGDNAELDTKMNQDILAFLEQNASDRSNDYLARKINRKLGREQPLKITESRYFRHEHDEVPRSVFSGPKAIKSLSNCEFCHTRADTGSFKEKEIKIPGLGRWDD